MLANSRLKSCRIYLNMTHNSGTPTAAASIGVQIIIVHSLGYDHSWCTLYHRVHIIPGTMYWKANFKVMVSI
jgi:hypothetical protein